MDHNKLALTQQSAGLFAASMSRPSRLAAFCKSIEDAQPQEVKDARAQARAAVEENHRAVLAAAKAKITPEFLATLAALSRALGERDEDRVVLDLYSVFQLAEVKMPDVQPIDFWTLKLDL